MINKDLIISYLNWESIIKMIEDDISDDAYDNIGEIATDAWWKLSKEDIDFIHRREIKESTDICKDNLDVIKELASKE